MPEINYDEVSHDLSARRQKLALLRQRRRLDEAATLQQGIALTERVAIQNAQNRSDPERTRRLLVDLAIRLSDGEQLSAEARHYLHDALIAVAKNPRHAGAAFGLVAPRRRPRRDSAQTLEILSEIMAERAKGIPLKSTRNRMGAFELVGARFFKSPDAIKAVWEPFASYVKATDPK